MQIRAPHTALLKKLSAIKTAARRHFACQTKSKVVALGNASGFDALLTKLPHLLWVTDAEGQCIFVNEAFVSFTGTPFEALLLDSWATFLHPDDVAETTFKWSHSIRHSTVHEAQYRIRRHDGVYRWMLARAVAMKDAFGRITHWAGTNTDIHELLGNVRSLRQDALKESDNVAAWVHDIRTPLTVIALKAETTLLHPGELQHVVDNMHAIMRSADHVASMTVEFLNGRSARATERARGATTSTDLRDIVFNSLIDLHALYPQRLTIRIDDQAIFGIWEATGIKRAIENLVNNAVKFGYSDTPIKVSLVRIENLAVISVHNDGPALSAVQQDLIFQPYVRISKPEQRDTEGWGLGLAVVKRVADEQGGIVDVESSATEGTTFRLHLPILECS